MAITRRTEPKSQPTFVRFTKIDSKQQKVWGIVYEPLSIDAHGDLMTREEIEKMAHDFLTNANLKLAVDENHNHVPTGSEIIESYVVRGEGDVGPAGSWVMAMKIPRDGTWKKILQGELTGFSFEGTGFTRPARVTATYQRYVIKYTTPAEDGHRHLFIVELDKSGRVIKGWTNDTEGHSHDILYNTITELSNDHRHRLIL